MESDFQMVTELEELQKRVDRIEKQKNQEVLSLVEILSNATFFGEVKKANCTFSKNGQCSFFILKSDVKNKIPIVSDCRIENCEESRLHYHLELSNITCALCEISNIDPIRAYSDLSQKGSKFEQKSGEYIQ
jgi:hypothetical protein